MRNAVSVLAVLGALACGVLGWKYKSDERTGEHFRQIRQIERDLARAGRDEQQVLLEMRIDPARHVEARTEHRWVLWLCYAMLAALPLGLLGGLLALHVKGWLGGPVLLLAAAGPLVCAGQLPSITQDAQLLAIPTGPLVLAGLLSFFLRARPAAPLVEPEPRTEPRQRSTSPVATILGWVLAVGGATAFSALAALDIVALVPAEPEVDRPLARQPQGPKDVPDQAPDDPPNALEAARWEAQRQEKFSKQQARERDIEAALHALPRGERNNSISLLTVEGEAVGDPIAFAPDAEAVASADRDGVSVWDLRTGERRHLMTGHTDQVNALAFSPDGQLLASAGEDGILRLWDLKTGKARHTLSPRTGRVGAVAFSPDGRQVVTSLGPFGSDNLVTVWDVQTGTAAGTFGDPPRGVIALVYSPQGKHLAVMGYLKETFHLYDAQSLRLRRTITCESSPDFLAFTPDGEGIVTAGNRKGKGVVEQWEVRTGKAVRTFEGDLPLVHVLALSPDGKRLMAQTHDKGLWAWDLATGKPQRIREGGLASTLVFSPGGVFLAVSDGVRVVVWATEDSVDPRLFPGLAVVRKFASVRRQGKGFRVQPHLPFKEENLAGLKALPRLVVLDLSNRTVSDAGLAHLVGLPDLEGLDLSFNTRVTDAGVAHVAKLEGLKTLWLSGTKVTEAGLGRVKGMTGLRELYLNNVEVTPAGLAHLKGMTGLTGLALDSAKVTDDGLDHLRGLDGMLWFTLKDNPDVTPAGLAHLKGMTRLGYLDLESVQVTDAGLAHLKGMTALETLCLSSTGVTDDGFAHLAGMTKLSDLRLGVLPDLRGPGLRHLKGMKDLNQLDLSATGVTDDGLAGLKELTQLESLTLPTTIGDAGVAHLAGLTSLTALSLNGTKVTGAGVAHLKGLAALEWLDLSGTKTGDSALEHLAGLKKLNTIFLLETSVTREAVAKLRKALPEATIKTR
jgi:WD40 repeat protein/Leucine-rich repeat (LRR) protein